MAASSGTPAAAGKRAVSDKTRGSGCARTPIRSAVFYTEREDDEGVVVAVYDGDTIRVKLDSGGSEIVRLIGIDAPELDEKREEIRFYAFMAKRFAFIQLYRERVRLVYDWEKRDKYNRLLAFVFTERGMFNEIILREGFASIFLKYPYRDDYRQRFRVAAAEARKEGRGLWRRGPEPVISAAEAADFIGRLVSVRFRCHEVQRTEDMVYLRAETGGFSVVGEKDRFEGLPDIRAYAGEWLLATGLVERYRGKPEIFVYMPRQLSFADK